MRPVTRIHSRTAVLADENIDTDRIIPARFLTTTTRDGLGTLCFHDWRYQAELCSEIADIFRNNALKNGLLAIMISATEHQWLLEHPGIELSIDVRGEYIALPDGGRVTFELEPFARHCLLNGIDQLGYLLQHADAITHYEQQPDHFQQEQAA
jgi:3-isopropylmalate/(R)-2-methylmalate dehydratase small subunit